MNETDRQPWNSGARIDATTILVMVRVQHLSAVLEPMGISIMPLSHAPEGHHPICVDLWHIERGRLESGGMDQHDWSSAAGATAVAMTGGWMGSAAGGGIGAIGGAAAGAFIGAPLGPIGSWWGSIAGYLAGGALGATAGAAMGASQGAALGANTGRETSEALSRVLGTYQEVLVATPNAVLPGGRGDPHMFVLGMYSNNPVSIWGDRAQGCGYRKRAATIRRDGFRGYEVRHQEQEAGLSGVFAAAPPDSWTRADARLERHRALFAQPLLGSLGHGRFAVSVLGRFLEDPEVRWAPVSGRLTVAAEFAAGLPAGDFRVSALSPDDPWGAFQATRVFTKVTPPIHT
jgi:hypothetical protein